MKLTSTELHPEGSSEAIVLSFRDPSSQNPYQIKAIMGLDADEITPLFYGGPGGSTKFFNMSLKKRVLVIRMALNPNFADETYSSLRDAIYRAVASSRTGLLEIQFKNGSTVEAVISGFVTKVEAPQFNKEPEAQITIECKNNPFLQAPARTNVSVVGLDPAATQIVDNVSQAPHGFVFTLTYTAPAASLVINDPDDDTWAFGIVPFGGFLTGDVLHFSSELNNKYLYIVRGASTIHLADKIALGSIWPIIFPGENNFELTSPANVDWTTIAHYHTFWGV